MWKKKKSFFFYDLSPMLLMLLLLFVPDPLLFSPLLDHLLDPPVALCVSVHPLQSGALRQHHLPDL